MQHSDAQKLDFLGGVGRGLFDVAGTISLGTDINGPWTFSHVGGRFILRGGRLLELFSSRRLLRFGAAPWLSSTSRTPKRATNVSMLLRSFNGYNFVFCGRGADAPAAANRSAWSLCCQQKKAAAPVSLSSLSLSLATETTAKTPLLFEALAPMLLRQGLPVEVIPLHVVAGFRESERGRSCSGVRPVKGIFTRERRVLWCSN